MNLRTFLAAVVCAAPLTTAHAKISARVEPSAARRAWTPHAATFDFREISLRLDKQDLDHKVFAFGVICSTGTRCTEGSGQSEARHVKLVRRDESLLLMPAQGEQIPVARWAIRDEDADALYVHPEPTGGLAMVHEMQGADAQARVRVFDRFHHDFRTDPRGVWFHETLRYEYKSVDFAALLSGGEPQEDWVPGVETLSIYLIDPAETASFVPKTPLPTVGYFVNATSMAKQMIYDGKEPFNPKGHVAQRWARDRTIDWVVAPNVPDELYAQIEQGILSWQEHLPATLRLSVRRAAPGEELDTPFINSLTFTPRDDAASFGGVASSSFHPATGEVFRANVNLNGPSSLTAQLPVGPRRQPEPKPVLKYGELTLSELCDLAPNAAASDLAAQLRGVTQHEIGHTFGLRHNFKGSLYDAAVDSLPAGSSVMEYPAKFDDMRIGPYDVSAIGWGYKDLDPAFYPFCTDERAGFLMLLPAMDPSCHRYDVTAADPYAHYLPLVQHLLRETVPGGAVEGDVTLGGLSMVTASIRDEELVAGRRAEALALLAIVGDYPPPANAAAEIAEWTAAKYLLAAVDSNLGAKLLTFPTLSRERAPLASALDWVARTPGSTEDIRKTRAAIAKDVAAWKDDAYGRPLVHGFAAALRRHSTESEDLALQNALLLATLGEN